MMTAGDEPDLILLTGPGVISNSQANPIPPASLSVPNYAMYLNLNFDPSNTDLGSEGRRGICIFVNLKWQATEASFTNCSFSEHLWISIPLQGQDLLLVGCIYRSPSAEGTTYTDNLVNLLHAAGNSKHTHLLVALFVGVLGCVDCSGHYAPIKLAGDSNIPVIEWTTSFSSDPPPPRTTLDGHHSHRFIEGI